MDNITIMDLVDELRNDATRRHLTVTPLSPPEDMYLERDLMWRTAQEIQRLRGAMARNNIRLPPRSRGTKL